MDRMLYTAMQGAQNVIHHQATNNNNLANIGTTGFRADLDIQEKALLEGPGFLARVGVTVNASVPDLTPSEITVTGRDLDLAIRGQGFITVQAADGSEAFTRAGELRIGSGGLLETASGHLVLGESGPIFVPPADAVEISEDGAISVIPAGQDANAPLLVDNIRLVNLPAAELLRTPEGLFVERNARDEGVTIETVAVKVTSGALESSNVNGAESLINMIELARHFELNVRLMKVSEELDESSASMLRLS